MIPVYKPYLTKNAAKYVNEAIESTWISSAGKFLTLATEKLQELLNVKHVQLVANGTCATHLVAKGLKWKTGCSELLVPDNVYVAAINSFLMDKGDFNLISIPSNKDTWNIDLKSLDTALQKIEIKDNFGVLIIHNIGNIINVPELKRKYPHIHFVEDNCEGFLGKYEGKYTGTESLISSISFFGNKNITAGECGAVYTNDSDIYEYIKCIQGQGQSNKRFVHSELGYNYRATNITAAILLSQLEAIPEIMERKSEVFQTYRNFCKSHTRFKPQVIDPNTQNAFWMFGVYMENSPGYDVIESFFKDLSIEIRPMFYPLSTHTHLQNNPYLDIWKEDVAKDLNQNCFILPSFPALTKAEQKYIFDAMIALDKTYQG